jgi:hypothetical protein
MTRSSDNEQHTFITLSGEYVLLIVRSQYQYYQSVKYFNREKYLSKYIFHLTHIFY